MDDAVSARIYALASENSALAAEVRALKAANADVAARAVGTSPSAGRKRARVEDPPSLGEALITTTELLELRKAVRVLEEREAARVPLLERLAVDARDVLNAHVLSRLDDGDLAVLATVNRKMRDVVFESPVGDVRDVAAVRRELARVRNFVGSVGRLAWAKDQEDVRGNRERSRASRGVGTWRSRGGRRNEDARGTSGLAPMPREAATWRCCSGCERTAAPWDEWTCAYAARGGHLEVLQWARANGAPWDEDTCTAAARSGHLEVLQWARANGCPWSEATCACAARGGHLEVLQWARANGAPWNPKDCEDAAYDHPHVLQWIAGEVEEGA